MKPTALISRLYAYGPVDIPSTNGLLIHVDQWTGRTEPVARGPLGEERIEGLYSATQVRELLAKLPGGQELAQKEILV